MLLDWLVGPTPGSFRLLVFPGGAWGTGGAGWARQRLGVCPWRPAPETRDAVGADDRGARCRSFRGALHLFRSKLARNSGRGGGPAARRGAGAGRWSAQDCPRSRPGPRFRPMSVSTRAVREGLAGRAAGGHGRLWVLAFCPGGSERVDPAPARVSCPTEEVSRPKPQRGRSGRGKPHRWPRGDDPPDRGPGAHGHRARGGPGRLNRDRTPVHSTAGNEFPFEGRPPAGPGPNFWRAWSPACSGPLRLSGPSSGMGPECGHNRVHHAGPRPLARFPWRAETNLILPTPGLGPRGADRLTTLTLAGWQPPAPAFAARAWGRARRQRAHLRGPTPTRRRSPLRLLGPRGKLTAEVPDRPPAAGRPPGFRHLAGSIPPASRTLDPTVYRIDVVADQPPVVAHHLPLASRRIWWTARARLLIALRGGPMIWGLGKTGACGIGLTRGRRRGPTELSTVEKRPLEMDLGKRAPARAAAAFTSGKHCRSQNQLRFPGTVIEILGWKRARPQTDVLRAPGIGPERNTSPRARRHRPGKSWADLMNRTTGHAQRRWRTPPVTREETDQNSSVGIITEKSRPAGAPRAAPPLRSGARRSPKIFHF